MHPTCSLRATALALTTTFLAACGGGGGGSDTRTVTLDFAAVAGSSPVACGTTIPGMGRGKIDVDLHDLRFYVSNVKLVTRTGAEVPLTLGDNDDWNLTEGEDRLSLIDLEDGTGACAEGGTTATNPSITGTVPEGDYVGVKLTLGVPFALNHTDYATAPAPLDVQALAWNWQFGRKHAQIEISDPAGVDSTWDSSVFYTHIGSTGCEGNPASGETVKCSAPNRLTFSLASFDPSKERIALDLKALLANDDLTKNGGGAPGCMSGGTDPECAGIFEALQLDWKSDGSGTGEPIDGGAAQTVFKAVAK